MTRIHVNRHRTSAFGWVALLALTLSPVASHAQVAPTAGSATSAANDPWLRLSTRPKDFVPAKLPWRLFTVDVPKGWTFAPGYRELIFSVNDKPKDNLSPASIVLEQMRLAVPLTAAEINDTLAGLEANAARTRDPGGQSFEQQIKTVSGRRLIFVTYTRPGFNGPDRVVLYAFPNGTVMYRLVCIAPAAVLAARYQGIFAHVAASFVPQPPGSD
jgi:hypothetical protein